MSAGILETDMSYKTILVHLDHRPRSSERLGLACSLAGEFDAHVVGLYAPGGSRLPSYAEAEGGPTLHELLEERRKQALQEAERRFREVTQRNGGERTEWRTSQADPASAIRLSARYADLVVAGQPEAEDEGDLRGLADELVFSAGRPVLFVPYAGRYPALGKRVLVAWDSGREAARAVTDALPFLRRATAVEVCAFDPEKSRRNHGAQPGADVGLYLARHDVKVTVTRQSGAGYDVGSQILSRAADVGADLIVMGAYGHARVREMVLGGATRTLLEAMTVPVLMSH
ncbi:MAG: universal stress protein [Betaproteobacteria bacterium]|nr:universal stress protein [Betaproteobacteria bacterium]